MHCISCYLVRRSDLRSEIIDNILLDKNNKNKIIFTDLKQGILAFTSAPNLKEFGKNKTIAKITTDYFGGAGEQTAKLFINNKVTYCDSINSALKLMGVERGSSDEFDQIGLGNYRTNKDFK